MRRLTLVLLMTLAAGCGKKGREAAPGPAPDAPVLPDAPLAPGEAARPWQADATLLARLEPAVTLGEYTIQPPKGYRKTWALGPPISVATWESPISPDGARAWLSVSTVENAGVDPEKTLEKHLATLTSVTEWLRRTPLERGSLNGIPFIRASYAGFDRIRDRVYIKGYAYAAVDGGRLIQLTAHEDVPREQETHLAMSEAALLTFRKR